MYFHVVYGGGRRRYGGARRNSLKDEGVINWVRECNPQPQRNWAS